MIIVIVIILIYIFCTFAGGFAIKDIPELFKTIPTLFQTTVTILVVFWFFIGGAVGVAKIMSLITDSKPHEGCSTDSDCLRKYGDDSNEEDDYPEDNGGKSSPGIHSLDGYYRKDGTYVEPYIRSNPDGDPSNNLRR
ncbi:hypothetical protein CT694_31330 (plasmid) [Bacillus wiedmannii bv. thuringiensis]|nr:hypothetical protein CT694_31330 [Bacillus wiedmannii bv. thuringiensis]